LDEAPRLIAFPEMIGFPLLLTLGVFAEIRVCRTVGEAARYLARRYWRTLVHLTFRRGMAGLAGLYAARAIPAFLAYTKAFAEAARFGKATIVAGTIILPPIDEEPSRGLHIRGRQAYNTAFIFSPAGRILGRTYKINLTAGAESHAGIARAPLSQLLPFDTPVGRLGVAICLDGFHSGVIERLDGLGAQIIVQPSANHAPWSRPWPADRRFTEGEAWLRFGLRAQLQDRCNIRYGLNPMMVGGVFDLLPRGRSSIVEKLALATVPLVTRGGVPEEQFPGIVKLAATADKEEIIRAAVAFV